MERTPFGRLLGEQILLKIDKGKEACVSCPTVIEDGYSHVVLVLVELTGSTQYFLQGVPGLLKDPNLFQLQV